MNGTLYDRIGHGYRDVRRPDPRIAAVIRRALGDARTVVNVGAGAGSYEPADLDVVAVEPSETMIAQRPPGSARVVRATAENLPFPDGSFDAALAVLTVHHWRDLRRGLAEMRRVAARVVVVTHDPVVGASFWLMEYFPGFLESEAIGLPPIKDLTTVLAPCAVVEIPVPADCCDGFLGAYWRRPSAYLDPAVRRGISFFRLAHDREALNSGLARLSSDLDDGTWKRRWGHLQTQDNLDLGYRLVQTA